MNENSDFKGLGQLPANPDFKGLGQLPAL